MSNYEPSFRARLLTRRTYNRPLNHEGTRFETWEDTIERVIQHQRWLWERALGRILNNQEVRELADLRQLMLDRKALLSGRTLWLGGTDVARRREASQFNCSFSRVETAADVVDCFWLLLQGCGVGFRAVPGQLQGFAQECDNVEVIRSYGSSERGEEGNIEYLAAGEWCISVGDSAEAWARAVGKLLAQNKPFRRLKLDFTQIRRAGVRLRGYGWISSGDETISKAFTEIVKIRNRRAGQQLTAMDIHDIMNWLGTTLSSRRSAEISLMDFGDPEAETFAGAKKNHHVLNPQRAQSNNSLVFWHKPTKLELRGLFQKMLDDGGSEPGFINGVAARERAPWFQGVNPCAEILLGHKSFCNLAEVDLGKFPGRQTQGLARAVRLIARANYRQTCVHLKDGVLSDAWHELNAALRLCGVSLTGIVKWMDSYNDDEHYGPVLAAIRDTARLGAEEMAHELRLPLPRAVTTVKPSGTLGKIMDTTEGAHRPAGAHIFNNINFAAADPIVDKLRAANYFVWPNPYDDKNVIVTVPVEYEGLEFTKKNGRWVNEESAVQQLERYKLLMDNYVEHNCSITISYDPSEVGEIVEWLHKHWDSYVGVSWILRQDHSKTAADLGYPYLPQECVGPDEWYAYYSKLRPVYLGDVSSADELDDDCPGGACPIR